MTGNNAKQSVETIPWFRRWFDSTYYHKLYAHRNDDEARNFVDTLVLTLEPVAGVSMIDVGCGTGRHAKFLAAKGFQVTGIDLAFSSIREAQKSAGKLLHFYRHDMRIPFGQNAFDYVFNFFTSFGYFKTENEHIGVIRNMANALKPGGTLVLDYLNPVYTENNLITAESMEIDGIVYNITRWVDEHHIYKKIAIEDGSIPGAFAHTEKVAKFSLIDFEKMFTRSGLIWNRVYGDYHLRTFDCNQSPRIIMVAQKLI